MTADHDLVSRAFASDNYAGVHPEVLDAIARANAGHVTAYGADPWTARFQSLCRELFCEDAQSFPVFNGTGANVIALQSVLPRWGAVIAPRSAHINGDEGGAPEKVGGIKIIPVETSDGKLTPSLVATEAWGFGDEHRAQPLAISLSQSTELGTCYTADEVRALADFAHEHGMALHMDGSRLGNAAAYLDASLREITADSGVDVLSLGATKNGALAAEAVVVLNPSRCRGLRYLRKTDMQLGSKMRFLSAQLLALYEGDLWLRSASHANDMAARLRRGLEGPGAGEADPDASSSPRAARSTLNGPSSGVPSATQPAEMRLSERPTGGQAADREGLLHRNPIPLPFPTQSNVVFAKLTPEQKARARQQFRFYDWPGDPGLVRLMCSWDTTTSDVDALVAAIGDGGDA